MSSWAFVLGDSVLGDFVLGAFVLQSGYLLKGLELNRETVQRAFISTFVFLRCSFKQESLFVTLDRTQSNKSSEQQNYPFCDFSLDIILPLRPQSDNATREIL